MQLPWPLGAGRQCSASAVAGKGTSDFRIPSSANPMCAREIEEDHAASSATPERLHVYLDDAPAAEFDAAYGAQQADQQMVGINTPGTTGSGRRAVQRCAREESVHVDGSACSSLNRR